MSRALAACALVIVIAACSIGSHDAVLRPRPAPSSSPPAQVYVALGASETAGIGTADPARESFPQQLLARFGAGSTLYDLGIPGETTAAALTDELPAALALDPSVATVFFNVDDLVAGVPVADFESHLDNIVGGLAAGGRTRVLVANTPPLDQLPAVTSCRSDPSTCLLKGAAVPSADQVRTLVAEYNAAIGRVVAAHRVALVDLTGAGLVVSQHPEYLSSDGLHPSAQGAAALAAAFYAALR